MKNQNHMIISIDVGKGKKKKTFDKIWHPFTIKTLQRVGTEGTHLNLRKVTYDKTIDNVIFNGEELKAFPLRSAKREVGLLLPVWFTIVLEVLAMKIREY